MDSFESSRCKMSRFGVLRWKSWSAITEWDKKNFSPNIYATTTFPSEAAILTGDFYDVVFMTITSHIIKLNIFSFFPLILLHHYYPILLRISLNSLSFNITVKRIEHLDLCSSRFSWIICLNPSWGNHCFHRRIASLSAVNYDQTKRGQCF